jgi:Zn finger protein HypA/HybF involved in hydrogenase expression
VPALIHCLHCQQDFGLDDPLDLRCPVCGTTRIRIVQGKELILCAIAIKSDDERAEE